MRGSRQKLSLLLGGLGVSALVLLASTQQWFGLTLTDQKQIAVAGQFAAPALSVLALTGIVLVGALSIAGPFFRVVLGSLQVLLGATIVLSAIVALAGPVSAASALITKATGVSGMGSVKALVTSISPSPWPWVALVAGGLFVVLGIAVVATARRWPGSSRKYSATRFDEPTSERDAVTDWDAQSRGSDPTARAK